MIFFKTGVIGRIFLIGGRRHDLRFITVTPFILVFFLESLQESCYYLKLSLKHANFIFCIR